MYEIIFLFQKYMIIVTIRIRTTWIIVKYLKCLTYCSCWTYYSCSNYAWCFFTWANTPFQEQGHLSLFKPQGTPYMFITKLEIMTWFFFLNYQFPKWLLSIWNCRTSGNCPWKYFAKFEYMLDMKFKIYIIFINLHTLQTIHINLKTFMDFFPGF